MLCPDWPFSFQPAEICPYSFSIERQVPQVGVMSKLKMFSTQFKIFKYFFQPMEELGFMRVLELTFNKLQNHAYPLETSKLIALMHATAFLSRNLVLSSLSEGVKYAKSILYSYAKSGQKSLCMCVSASEGLFTASMVLGLPPHSASKALLKPVSGSGHEE